MHGQAETPRKITVVGCGVAGLTTATVLRQLGCDVTIVAAKLPFDTVSIVAGAIWAPSTLAPSDRVPGWALRTREVFATLVSQPDAGVEPLTMTDLHVEDPGPQWGEDTPYVRRLGPDELPPGYATGFSIDGFRVDPPTYLRWMIDRFTEMGGTIVIESLALLGDVDGELVVNCSGLGARELANDASMFGIRGQVVAVANPGITTGIADESDPDRIAYIYPRPTEMVLGGTRDAGNADLDPDPAIRDRILADTAALDPRLAGLDIITERVGFRPGRPEVRVEAAQLPDGRGVIHNYGHGGGGYLMSWGCAEEVASIMAQRFP